MANIKPDEISQIAASIYDHWRDGRNPTVASVMKDIGKRSTQWVQDRMAPARAEAANELKNREIESKEDYALPSDVAAALRQHINNIVDQRVAMELDKYKGERNALAQAKDAFKAEKDALLTEKGKMQNEIATQAANLQTAIEDLSNAKNEITTLDSNVRRLMSENATLAGKYEEAEKERESLLKEVRAQKDALDDMVATKDDLIAERNDAKAIIKECRENILHLKERLQDEQRAAHTRESEWVTKLDTSVDQVTRLIEELAVAKATASMESANRAEKEDRVLALEQKLSESEETVTAFRTEATRLQTQLETYKALEKSNRDDERAVAKRNTALERANAALEKEIERLRKMGSDDH